MNQSRLVKKEMTLKK